MKTSFQSIASQAAEILRTEIREGTWRGSLPSERKLAETLHVSRKTIRAALAELRADGAIVTIPGAANQIATRRGRKAAREARRIGLLLREPLERLRPYTVIWVNELRERLRSSGLQLDIHHSHQYFGPDSRRSLTRLVKTTPADCWLLAGSSRALQEWFQKAHLPALVAGSTHAAISLPSVDIDHRALGRHAATQLLRHGHRKIALFLSEGDLGGDVETEAGFREALAAYPNSRPPLVFRTSSERDDIIASVRRALTPRESASAFILSSPFSYLTTLSFLGTIGRKVPSDVSLISCVREPLFDHLCPAPAHYDFPPLRLASELSREIKHIVRLGQAAPRKVRIMPDFVRGESIAPV